MTAPDPGNVCAECDSPIDADGNPPSCWYGAYGDCDECGACNCDGSC